MPQCGDLAALRAFLRDHGIRVCEHTISNWIKKGLLPRPFHIGRRAFYDFADVAQAIVRLKNGEGGVNHED
jgi:hypothetical protein